MPGVVVDRAGAIKIIATGTRPLVVIFGPRVVRGAKLLPLQTHHSRRLGLRWSIYLKAPDLVIQTGVKISANGGAGADGITVCETI